MRALQYFHYRSEEIVGEPEWGASDWYFEADSDGTVLRQVEAYEHGPALKYGESEPDYLAEKPVDTSVPGLTEIPKEEFERAWERAQVGPAAK